MSMSLEHMRAPNHWVLVAEVLFFESPYLIYGLIFTEFFGLDMPGVYQLNVPLLLLLL
jgi:hypothetical protein